MPGCRRRRSCLILAFALLVAAVGCSTAGSARRGRSTDGRLAVVAAESSWGSIAGQLGGDRVAMTEIVDNPDADPHDYEPTPADARAVAGAAYVIVNGLGYDSWASDLVAADDAPGRTVLDVGDLLGLEVGANPHRWYFPDDVTRVIDHITADYERLDPDHAAYYEQLHATFTGTTLQPYRALIDQIRSSHSGTPVGASESVVVGLVDATRLHLLTPTSFLDAVTEGNDPAAADKVTIDAQIANHEISVFLFNSQNSTPDVQELVSAARGHDIPVVTMTETPSPAGIPFQDWQTAQLRQLADALAAGSTPSTDTG